MLSDQDGSIGKLYGIYDEDSGTETRGRFIIDPDGIVQGFEVLTPTVGRNVSETIRQIKAYRLVRASGGTEVTPSGWKPGKRTLKPGPDLLKCMEGMEGIRSRINWIDLKMVVAYTLPSFIYQERYIFKSKLPGDSLDVYCYWGNV